MYALSEVRAVTTPGRGVGAGVLHLRAGSDVHADNRARLLAGGEERIPEPVLVVDGRQAEIGRQLGEGNGVEAAGGVAPDLGGGQRRIPQRHEAQRDQPPSTRAAPLLAHPVVEGADTRQRQVLVLGLEEHLAGKTREGREAHGALRAVDVHVGQAGHGVIAPRSHGGEGDRGRRQLVAGEADARHHLGDRPDQVLVDPPVHHGAVAAPFVRDVVGPRHLDRPAAVLFDVGPAGTELRRQPRRPHMRWFDHVVVDRDHPGQVGLGQLASSDAVFSQMARS